MKKKNHLSVSNAVCQIFSGSDFQILDKHPSLSVLGDKYGSFVTDLFSDDNNSLSVSRTNNQKVFRQIYVESQRNKISFTVCCEQT